MVAPLSLAADLSPTSRSWLCLFLCHSHLVSLACSPLLTPWMLTLRSPFSSLFSAYKHFLGEFFQPEVFNIIYSLIIFKFISLVCTVLPSSRLLYPLTHLLFLLGVLQALKFILFRTELLISNLNYFLATIFSQYSTATHPAVQAVVLWYYPRFLLPSLPSGSSPAVFQSDSRIYLECIWFLPCHQGRVQAAIIPSWASIATIN